MIIGTDASGKVWMTSPGKDVSVIPGVWNGITLTVNVLTDEQEAAYNALSENRGGTQFDGTFHADAAPPEREPSATLEDVIAAMPPDIKAKIDAAVDARKKPKVK